MLSLIVKGLAIMENNLLPKDSSLLRGLGPEHGAMMAYIEQHLPAVIEHSKNYGKRQSQFMDNMLTCSHPTPIRNLRQITAEIENTMQALREAYFRQKKTMVEIKILQRKIGKELDELQRELLEVELEEKQAGLTAGQLYISGAIRKIANYIEQFKSIMAMLGVSSIDEIDFEAEEERYHIMKAFDQALCAARASGGRIDEGNHIYFYQIGISGASAFMDVTEFMRSEIAVMQTGNEPGHEMILEFLNRMAEKYRGCSRKYALYKGQTGGISRISCIVNRESNKHDFTSHDPQITNDDP